MMYKQAAISVTGLPLRIRREDVGSAKTRTLPSLPAIEPSYEYRAMMNTVYEIQRNIMNKMISRISPVEYKALEPLFNAEANVKVFPLKTSNPESFCRSFFDLYVIHFVMSTLSRSSDVSDLGLKDKMQKCADSVGRRLNRHSTEFLGMPSNISRESQHIFKEYERKQWNSLLADRGADTRFVETDYERYQGAVMRHLQGTGRMVSVMNPFYNPKNVTVNPISYHQGLREALEGVPQAILNMVNCAPDGMLLHPLLKDQLTRTVPGTSEFFEFVTNEASSLKVGDGNEKKVPKVLTVDRLRTQLEQYVKDLGPEYVLVSVPRRVPKLTQEALDYLMANQAAVKAGYQLQANPQAAVDPKHKDASGKIALAEFCKLLDVEEIRDYPVVCTQKTRELVEAKGAQDLDTRVLGNLLQATSDTLMTASEPSTSERGKLTLKLILGTGSELGVRSDGTIAPKEIVKTPGGMDNAKKAFDNAAAENKEELGNKRYMLQASELQEVARGHQCQVAELMTKYPQLFSKGKDPKKVLMSRPEEHQSYNYDICLRVYEKAESRELAAQTSDIQQKIKEVSELTGKEKLQSAFGTKVNGDAIRDSNSGDERLLDNFVSMACSFAIHMTADQLEIYKTYLMSPGSDVATVKIATVPEFVGHVHAFETWTGHKAMIAADIKYLVESGTIDLRHYDKETLHGINMLFAAMGFKASSRPCWKPLLEFSI